MYEDKGFYEFFCIILLITFILVIILTNNIFTLFILSFFVFMSYKLKDNIMLIALLLINVVLLLICSSVNNLLLLKIIVIFDYVYYFYNRYYNINTSVFNENMLFNKVFNINYNKMKEKGDKIDDDKMKEIANSKSLEDINTINNIDDIRFDVNENRDIYISRYDTIFVAFHLFFLFISILVGSWLLYVI